MALGADPRRRLRCAGLGRRGGGRGVGGGGEPCPAHAGARALRGPHRGARRNRDGFLSDGGAPDRPAPRTGIAAPGRVAAELIRARDEARAPSLLLLPLMVLWANLHGG